MVRLEREDVQKVKLTGFRDNLNTVEQGERGVKDGTQFSQAWVSPALGTGKDKSYIPNTKTELSLRPKQSSEKNLPQLLTAPNITGVWQSELSVIKPFIATLKP